MSDDTTAVTVKVHSGLHIRVSQHALDGRTLISLFKQARTSRGIPLGVDTYLAIAVGQEGERARIRIDSCDPTSFGVFIGGAAFYMPEASAKKVATRLGIDLPRSTP